MTVQLAATLLGVGTCDGWLVLVAACPVAATAALIRSKI